MKIVHICLASLVIDGWSYQDNLLPKYHKKMGHEVYIITSKWIRNIKGELILDNRQHYINDDGVEIFRLSMKNKENFNNKFKKFYNLYETIDCIKPEILFIHSVSFCDISLIVRWLKNNMNVTVFADNHADFSNSATTWLSKNILHKIIWRYYAKKLIPYVKKFWGVLPARVKFLYDVYNIPKSKCEYLPMGADDELVERALINKSLKAIRKKFNILDEDFLIVAGGKFDSAKRQILLLMDAIRSIDDRYLKLIIFGSMDDYITEKARVFLEENRIIYAGWIDVESSYDYFAAADIVAFPGRHSVFWEQAAGQGKPMICKKWEGTTHVDFGGNVCFIEEDSVEEIKKIILEIVHNPNKFIKMKQIAEKYAYKSFLYSEIAKKSIQ